MSARSERIAELKNAVVELSSRGLIHSSRWAAEMLHNLLINIQQNNAMEEDNIDNNNNNNSLNQSTQKQQPSSNVKSTTNKNNNNVNNEQLIGSTPKFESKTPSSNVFSTTQNSKLNSPAQFNTTSGLEINEELENSIFLVAKSYFDLREFYRAADILKNSNISKSLFLRSYSLYLAGEKKKEEELTEREGTLGSGGSQQGEGVAAVPQSISNPPFPINQELKQLYSILHSLYLQRSYLMDSFNLYMYGLVMREMGWKDRSLGAFIESLNQNPLNWSCWLDLAAVWVDLTTISVPDSENGWLKNVNEIPTMGTPGSSTPSSSLNHFTSFNKSTNNFNSLLSQLPNHWTKNFFIAHVKLETQKNSEAMEVYHNLANQFPNCSYILTQVAITHYNQLEYDQAEEIYDRLIKGDEFRLEGLEVYSNILYVLDNKPKLSFLAHKAHLIDKYRPETCCIIGNYYSKKNEHQKAVDYFKRALKLNRKFLSAWTLMGHEFLELKNRNAAIEAYRTAVDLNPRDYRAWYGLGQTYELLRLPLYALYYYKKAVALRPFDSRFWCAVGSTYEMMDSDKNPSGLFKPNNLANNANNSNSASNNNESQSDPDNLMSAYGSGFNQSKSQGKEKAYLREAIQCYERAITVGDREGMVSSKLASLYQELNQNDKAAYYHKIVFDSFDQNRQDVKDVLPSLNFLVRYCIKQTQLTDARAYCEKLLDLSAGEKEKEDAKSMLHDISTLQNQK